MYSKFYVYLPGSLTTVLLCALLILRKIHAAITSTLEQSLFAFELFICSCSIKTKHYTNMDVCLRSEQHKSAVQFRTGIIPIENVMIQNNQK